MGRTILVADDDPSILDLLDDVLTDEGYRVLRARDGAQALARLEAGGCDLLLTDNMMPVMSGTELIARLRERPDLAVPVILMSAAPPIPRPGPPVVFLAKPFDLADLLATVATLLAPADEPPRPRQVAR